MATRGSRSQVRRPIAAPLRSLLAVGLFLSTSAGSSSRAEDWPQWRGPRRDGSCREAGLAPVFGAEGLKIVWKCPVGWGWSSPVVAGGRVFVADSKLANPQAEERLQCLDAATGKTLWTRSYPVVYPDWVFVPNQEAGPSATPIVADGRVYTVGGNGRVECLEAGDGTLVWGRDLDKDYKIEVLKCRASPLIDEDRLIVFVGGRPDACLMALDRRTGKEIWKAVDEPVSNSSPIVVEAGGRRQLIAWSEQSVTSLDPATGAIYWTEKMVTSNNDAIPTPVCEKNRLLISGLMFELAADTPTAKVLWPANRSAARRTLSNTSTPLLTGEFVYSAKSSGQLVCLEAHTGRQLWETDQITDIKGGASIHLTPVGDKVYLFNDRGELILGQLSPDGYREISRARLIDPVYQFGGRKVAWAPPAFANRHVFARSEKELVCASLAESGKSD